MGGIFREIVPFLSGLVFWPTVSASRTAVLQRVMGVSPCTDRLDQACSRAQGWSFCPRRFKCDKIRSMLESVKRTKRMFLKESTRQRIA